ncbi:MAG: tyrosine-type recombinase/integrase [Desulfobacterales bacterium]|nr:tyrosine-type recombinase/integrase [Desulfobacterales bacterium]
MAKVAKRRGRYVLDYYDNRGIRKWVTMPEGTNLKDAKKELRRIEEQLDRGTYVTRKAVKNFKTVAQDWLESKKHDVRASTYAMYEGHLRNHFGMVDELKINRITIRTVERFISKHREVGRNISTLKKILGTFSQVMRYAVRHRLIDYNPLVDAERPRRQDHSDEKQIIVLNPQQIKAFVGLVKDQLYRVFVQLATLSGARQGELFGLKWADIDWDNGQIRINRTYNNGAWYQPISKASKRAIDLGPSMMLELQHWRMRWPLNELDLVFPSQGGGPIIHSVMLRKHFWPALKAAELPRIRFHDLRHTFASLLIDQGENIKYIQSQLGHSSPTLTLDTYSHLLKSTNQKAARRLEGVVFQATGSKMVATGTSGKSINSVTN